MRILADENIPLVKEVFPTIGEVVTVPGRSIDRTLVHGFDALLVRSVTGVDEDLLSGSLIKFVGTATIGTDHLDMDYLDKAGITTVSAPGSNANSVVEYIFAVIVQHAVECSRSLDSFSLGVVGVGAIGSRLAARAEKFGMKVLRNDPPLQEAGTSGDWHDLDELFKCDILTLHVPLKKDGPFRTFHLFDETKLARLNKGIFLINASRGSVVDNGALLDALNKVIPAKVALDVWENEPLIDIKLLSKVDIGTPHIAGYSYDGKINGTIMLYQAMCKMTRIPPDPDLLKKFVQPLGSMIEIDNKGKNHEESLYEIVRSVYNIRRDDNNLRGILKIVDSAERGRHFDALRKNYPTRREFFNYNVKLSVLDTDLKSKVKILGFRTEE